MKSSSVGKFRNVGFISTRIAGTDGVSLEIGKWAAVLERRDFACFYFSGENDRRPEKCMLVEEAHFFHPEIQEINDQCLGQHIRPRETGFPTIQHAVINSLASQQLSYRKGISNSIIPNVYDFASPPSPRPENSKVQRQDVGLEEDDLFILQPMRMIPRK